MAAGLVTAIVLAAIAALAGRQPLSGSGSSQPGTSAGPQPGISDAPHAPSTLAESLHGSGGTLSGSPFHDGGQRVASAYAKLPLPFIPNVGRTDERVRYYTQGAGFGFFFTDDRVVLSLEKGGRGQALHLRFSGRARRPSWWRPIGRTAASTT